MADLFKAILKYPGPPCPDHDTLLAAGVSEAGAHAYGRSKGHTTAPTGQEVPGKVAVLPMAAGDKPFIPDDYVEPALEPKASKKADSHA